MKRQIKFRGKSSICDNWLYGYLLCIGYQYYIAEENDFDTDGHHIKQVQDMPLDVEAETIGQFTGLYDETGKEIYEGDILKFFYIAYYSRFDSALKVYRIGEVAFVDGCFRLINLIDYDGIDLKKKSELQPCKGYDMEFHSNFCSVIGNIHDNKDLLNKE